MSTVYEELHEHQGESCAEQKLRVLRAELVRPVMTVQSAVTLLKQVESDIASHLPETIRPQEFEHLVAWLDEAAADLKDILDALAADCAETDAHRVN